jgi:diacylglycerol kinase family enzyme
MAMRATVIVNAASGVRERQVGEECERIAAGLQSRGVEADVRHVPGPRLTEAAREAAAKGAEAVVMSGGDGTMSAGAAALAGGDVPMGILPLGTLNHFARDLGIPTDLDAALAVVAAGIVKRVDVGEANGRVFVNNASIGLYPHAVAVREKEQEEKGTAKWLAMCRAGLATLRRFPVVRVTLRLPDGGRRLTTPLVFIGNNRYEMSLFSLGTREALDGGELWVYVAVNRGRLGFVRLALRAVLGRLDQARDFLGVSVPELTIEDRRRTIRIAFDGEVCHVDSPLVFRSRPAALPILVPAPAEQIDDPGNGSRAERDSVPAQHPPAR